MADFDQIEMCHLQHLHDQPCQLIFIAQTCLACYYSNLLLPFGMMKETILSDFDTPIVYYNYKYYNYYLI
jgi:hypothetical protein